VSRFKFLDESSVNSSLTRLYGRAAPGERVVDSTPQPSGLQTTTLAVIGLEGITAPMVLSGSVKGTVFYGYLQQCVIPTLAPGDILFMDNLTAHKVAGIKKLSQNRISWHNSILKRQGANYAHAQTTTAHFVGSPRWTMGTH